MKIFSFLICISLLAASFSCSDSSAKIAAVKNVNEGFAVVELFTSEGCSSCPPADNAVARLLNEHQNNVFVLSYHVDYWNNLGWKDIFSNASYTQIQREYAKSFYLSSVYTPQIVVNGTEQFVGSSENKLKAAVNNDLQQAATATLNIEAKTNSNNIVAVSYNTNTTNASIKIALIQLHAENKIHSGENSGATLHHVNIVRDLKTVSGDKGNITLTLPEGLTVKDFMVIGFAQNSGDNKITAAAEVSIN